jgi:acyl carrier protein
MASRILGCSKQVEESAMDVQAEVLRVLDEVLSLGGRGLDFTRETHLLGAIPELDSMAVVTLITTLEEQTGITVDDDEIDGDTFATVGALVDFVSAKLG